MLTATKKVMLVLNGDGFNFAMKSKTITTDDMSPIYNLKVADTVEYERDGERGLAQVIEVLNGKTMSVTYSLYDDRPDKKITLEPLYTE